MVCNIAQLQLLAFLCPNVTVHVVFYPGLLIAAQVIASFAFNPIIITEIWLFQAMFSGFVVLCSTMKDWYKWGVKLNHAYWYMSALFSNEFHGNENALGYSEYSKLAEFFEWRSTCAVSVTALFLCFFSMRFFAYFAMKHIDFTKR